LLDGARWQLVCAGSDRNSDCQPHSTDGSNRHDSANLNNGASGASINANGST